MYMITQRIIISLRLGVLIHFIHVTINRQKIYHKIVSISRIVVKI